MIKRVVRATLASVQCSAWVAADIPAFPTTAPTGYGNWTVGATSATGDKGASISAATYSKVTYEYVDIAGNVITQTTGTGRNYIRYCEYPGERLFREVKFDVNGRICR